MGVSSENANVIVGIEVAGWSKEVTVYQNYINLNDFIGVDPKDNFIGLRFRSKVERDTVIEKRNVLIQGAEHEEEDPEILVRHSRALVDARISSPHSEWIYGETPGYGGCPFARN